MVAAVSCKKDQQPESTSPRISISAAMSDGTKAILHEGDLNGKSALQIYDYRGSETVPFINDQVSYPTTPNEVTWKWGSEPADGYSWLNGNARIDHHFFGWLTTDKSGLKASDLFGTSGLVFPGTGEIKTLTVPQTAMTLSSKQFDFCYSDMINRIAEKTDYSTVQIPLHHLFTCFGLKVGNYSSNAISISSIKLFGLVNNKGAKIAYDTEEGKATVTYGTTGLAKLGGTSGVELLGSTINLTTTNPVANNAITATGLGTDATDALFLMWPQTADELNIADANAPTTSEAVLQITYKVDGGSNVTKVIPLRPESWVDGTTHKNTVGWDAGTCHKLELAFTDTQLSLKVTVAPWDLYEPTINYDVETQIKTGGQLKFNTTTCTIDSDNKRIYFKGGNPITGTFTLEKPFNGTWLITKEGSWDSFELDNADLTTFGNTDESNYGTIDGNPATFTIYPFITDPDSDREITLKFSVRASNGQIYDANDIIYGTGTGSYKGYKIVLQAS